jgi:T5SS/PEP-CTERM-associated repeat protein
MSTPILPPGVPLELFEALPKSTRFFDGQGQAGNWADPQNWWHGPVPVTTSVVVVPTNAVLNGSFTAKTVMFLGNEVVTVNGDLTTMNTNVCESFMVCDEADAVFNPGSALNVAGALIVGNDDLGTLLATGSATLTSVNAKIGRLDGGIGHVTIDGAHWSNATGIAVGFSGAGTLTVTDGGHVSSGNDVDVGCFTGSSGLLAVTNGSTLSVGSSLNLGSGPNSAMGSGTAQVVVDATSAITFGAAVTINAGEAIALQGGSLTGGMYSSAVRVTPGGTLSGFGTVTSANGGIADFGTIVASGGTLVLDSALSGNGVLDIAANSTATIEGAALGNVGVVFSGQGATLDLSQGILQHGTLQDFGAGDSIVMQGVTGLTFNAVNDVLSLTGAGHVVDKLHFAGSYQSTSFTLSQSGAGAVIGFNPGH